MDGAASESRVARALRQEPTRVAGATVTRVAGSGSGLPADRLRGSSSPRPDRVRVDGCRFRRRWCGSGVRRNTASRVEAITAHRRGRVTARPSAPATARRPPGPVTALLRGPATARRNTAARAVADTARPTQAAAAATVAVAATVPAVGAGIRPRLPTEAGGNRFSSAFLPLGPVSSVMRARLFLFHS